MKPGSKIWAAFVAVAKVLKAADLEAFGRALFFATGFRKLSNGAKRTVTALGLKLRVPASALWNALAVQSWGVGELRAIAAKVQQGAAYPELGASTRGKLDAAAETLPWPAPLPTGPRPPLLPDPAGEPETTSDQAGVALAIGAALVVLFVML